MKKINNKYSIFIDNGKTIIKSSAIDWIQKVQELGAGELLVTSIDFEGTMNGYDHLLLKKIENILKFL